MFTSHMLKKAKQHIAKKRFDSVRDICTELTVHADRINFFDLSNEEMRDHVDDFVHTFCFETGLFAHNIRPMCWSFEVENDCLYEDGVIEFRLSKTGQAYFCYIDVSECKITDPDAQVQVPLFDDPKIASIQKAYIRRLSTSLASWKEEFSNSTDSAVDSIKESIFALEQKLKHYGDDASSTWKNARTELEALWNDVEVKIKKYRNQ